MKSVLRNLTLRADASLLGHVEDFQPLDNSVAVHGVNEGIASPPQDKQLAELKLLSRVEHDVAASSLLSSVTSGNDEGSRNQNVRRLDQHDGHKGNTKIAFTAVLSGGERVSTLFHNQPDSTASTNPSSTVVPSALMKKGNRLQQTSALPTLCEEEGCTEEETHTEPLLETNPNGEFTPLDDTEMDPLLGQCPTFRQMLVIDTNESEHEGESSQFSDLPSDKHPEVSDDDNDERDEADDEAFAEMLAQLPNDSSSLMLSISDFTVPRLSRVRDALAQAASPCREVSSDADRTQDDRMGNILSLNSHGSPVPSLARMRHLRTILAIDTIRCFLQRYERENVLHAISDAVRQIFDHYARIHSIGPLRRTPVVVTSTNITRVALLTRQSLMLPVKEASESSLLCASPCKSSTHSRCSAPASSWSVESHQARCQSSQQRKRSPSKSSRRVEATSKALLRNGISTSGIKALGGSPCTRDGVASTSPQRRSILASDGTHVLLQEKIGAFQYRGTSGSGLALFKVNREDAATADAAARRRQRSIAYGNECKRTYLNMK